MRPNPVRGLPAPHPRREDDDFRSWPSSPTRTAATPSRSRPTAADLVGSARGPTCSPGGDRPADGSERVIDADEVADLGGPILSDRTGELLGAVYLRDRSVCTAIDPTSPATRTGSGAAPRRSEDHRPGHRGAAWVVAFEDDRDPLATYVFDRASGTAELPLKPRPWLDPATLAPMDR